MTYTCEIVTPYRRMYRGLIESLTLSSPEGRIEFLAGHESALAPVEACALVMRGPDGLKTAAVSFGFVRVNGTTATVIVDAAEWPEEIDLERAKAALIRAEERLKAPDSQSWIISQSRQAKARAINRVQIAEAHKTASA